MTKYIANEANLKMMMNLLRDKSKNIQFEAFHVFKVHTSLSLLLCACELHLIYPFCVGVIGVRRKPEEATTD